MAIILIIDDEPAFRKVTRAMLEHLGHCTVELGNAKQACQYYEAVRPDLVFLDMLMPDQDGLETMQQLRALDPNARIMAVSGGGRIDASVYLKFAIRMRATDHLAKPFTVAELAAAMERVLGGEAENQAREFGSRDCASPA